jgi:hypothetical protein
MRRAAGAALVDRNGSGRRTSSVRRTGRGPPWRPCHEPHSRANKGRRDPHRNKAEEAFPPWASSVTPGPARPCGGCECECGAGSVPCFMATTPLPVPVRRLFVAEPPCEGRRSRTGGAESRGGVLPFRTPLVRFICDERVRVWLPVSGWDNCQGDGCAGASRGSSLPIAVNLMGGTIPAPPILSTGKGVTPRCQWPVARTCAGIMSSDDDAVAAVPSQESIGSVIPRSGIRVGGAAIR